MLQPADIFFIECIGLLCRYVNQPDQFCLSITWHGEEDSVVADSKPIEISAPRELVNTLPVEHWANPPRRFVKNLKNKILAIPRVGVLTRHSAATQFSNNVGFGEQKPL